MPIDYERLLNFPIPEVRQTVRPQDVALYALSVGLGQDSTNEAELSFVDFSRDLKVLPSMAAVLANPGFWQGNPATGIDTRQLVQGEQSVKIHRPLPTNGEVVGRTRVVDVVDKGAGRGALLYVRKELTSAQDGEMLAEARTTSILRGNGGFGGATRSVPQPHPLPDRSPEFCVALATRPEQALLYRLNGDANPLHSDPQFAAKAGFPRPILHGLCTFGVVTHAILRSLCDYDPSRLREIALRFTSPVYPGETIRTEVWSDGSFLAFSIERNVVVINNGRAVVS